MPLTKKGEKIEKEMKKEYGSTKGKQVFYASINKGKITGAEKGKNKTHAVKKKSKVKKKK